jgi:hypothetical protein
MATAWPRSGISKRDWNQLQKRPTARAFPAAILWRMLYDARVIRKIVALAALLFVSAGLLDCNSQNGCPAGAHCECSGGEACLIGCDGDGCDEACHSLNNCRTECGNACTSQCHDVMECSQTCGAGCSLECFSTPNCDLSCGPGCRYQCHDASQCTARVGDKSEVTCDHTGSCTVECVGSCVVHCSGNNCLVTCQDGSPASACGAGRFACGGC